MTKLMTLAATCVAAAVVAGAGAGRGDAAIWCWPGSCGYQRMFGWTYSATGSPCFYAWGEVCSGWNYWSREDYYRRNRNLYGATILYGFENGGVIRGRKDRWFDAGCMPCAIRPGDVAMGGYLRAQSVWWDSGWVGGQAYDVSADIGPIAFA